MGLSIPSIWAIMTGRKVRSPAEALKVVHREVLTEAHKEEEVRRAGAHPEAIVRIRVPTVVLEEGAVLPIRISSIELVRPKRIDRSWSRLI